MNILNFKTWLMEGETAGAVDPIARAAEQTAKMAMATEIENQKKKDPKNKVLHAGQAAVIKSGIPLNKIGDVLPTTNSTDKK